MKNEREEWRALVHVCQKWRNNVFGSPHRLDLQLFCTDRTPVRKMLDVWPLLPIVVMGFDLEKWGVDNVIAALEHADRICEFALYSFMHSISLREKVLAAMLQPFPALKSLRLQLICESAPASAPVLPASFLGGYAHANTRTPRYSVSSVSAEVKLDSGFRRRHGMQKQDAERRRGGGSLNFIQCGRPLNFIHVISNSFYLTS